MFLVDLGLPKEQLAEFCITGSFGDVLKFDNFTGVACLHIGQVGTPKFQRVFNLLLANFRSIETYLSIAE